LKFIGGLPTQYQDRVLPQWVVNYWTKMCKSQSCLGDAELSGHLYISTRVDKKWL